MGAEKLNTASPNNELGLYFTRSRRVVVGTAFGEMATCIKCSVAGVVVWSNSETGEIGVWSLEAGEFFPVICDKILVSGTVGGVVETTTATGMFWATAASNVGKEF